VQAASEALMQRGSSRKIDELKGRYNEVQSDMRHRILKLKMAKTWCYIIACLTIGFVWYFSNEGSPLRDSDTSDKYYYLLSIIILVVAIEWYFRSRVNNIRDAEKYKGDIFDNEIQSDRNKD